MIIHEEDAFDILSWALQDSKDPSFQLTSVTFYFIDTVHCSGVIDRILEHFKNSLIGKWKVSNLPKNAIFIFLQMFNGSIGGIGSICAILRLYI